MGFAGTTGAIVFVPEGFAGTGRAKILAYDSDSNGDPIVAVRGYTVPEPTTGLLALLGVAIFARRRRRDP